METVPGGLSGGGCNSIDVNCEAETCGCGSSPTTIPFKAGRMSCALDVTTIELGGLILFRQHDCDEGMSIEPHCSAMCLQHSRSASVISAPGTIHAIAGSPNKTVSSRALTSWRVVFTF